MQTMTDLSSLNLEISGQKTIPQALGLFKQFGRVTQKTDLFQYLPKVEKWTNRFFLIIVAVSALYFTPIVISIFSR